MEAWRKPTLLSCGCPALAEMLDYFHKQRDFERELGLNGASSQWKAGRHRPLFKNELAARNWLERREKSSIEYVDPDSVEKQPEAEVDYLFPLEAPVEKAGSAQDYGDKDPAIRRRILTLDCTDRELDTLRALADAVHISPIVVLA